MFFFVSGRTPQIITETLFFFLVHHRPTIRPHEIHVLTTSEGQALIVSQLLDPRTGEFYRFCREYGLNPHAVRFSAETVEILRDENGTPLTDIRTDADNRAAADQIVAKVRALTSDPHSRLFASMAGGRKTMGLYLGFALQFYSRPQDRLTHVLVSPPELENNPQFFYPPTRRLSFSSPHGSVPGRAATVTVAEVPLILLGHKLPVLRDRANLSYATLVAQSQREVDLLTALLPLTIGGFGSVFKETVCVVDHRDCARCLLRSRCAFPYVFDTPVPEDATRLRKYPAAPHPFVFLPPLEEKTLYRPGETLAFDLTLIGKGADFRVCPTKSISNRF